MISYLVSTNQLSSFPHEFHPSHVTNFRVEKFFVQNLISSRTNTVCVRYIDKRVEGKILIHD